VVLGATLPHTAPPETELKKKLMTGSKAIIPMSIVKPIAVCANW